MKALVFFLVSLALGTVNLIGPITAEPSREDRIKTAIDSNVHWLLSGIREGTFEGPDLPRAVVALFLAEPGLFSPGHKIGRELREKINTPLNELIRQVRIREATRTGFYRSNKRLDLNISIEELASYVQAVTVSCQNPSEFFGYDLANEIWERGMRSQQNGRFSSSAFLALCNADKTYFLAYLFDRVVILSDEEAVTMMSIDCFESHFPFNHPSVQSFGMIHKSGYQHYPSNLTVEKLEEMLNPDNGNSTSLSAIAAAMQTLMHIRQLRVSDLPSAVDFLLNSQDEDGSWGQSTLNSYLILPVLSNRSFLDINRGHCPPYNLEEEDATSPNRDFYLRPTTAAPKL